MDNHGPNSTGGTINKDMALFAAEVPGPAKRLKELGSRKTLEICGPTLPGSASHPCFAPWQEKELVCNAAESSSFFSGSRPPVRT